LIETEEMLIEMGRGLGLDFDNPEKMKEILDR
jgi:hypothetical protein